MKVLLLALAALVTQDVVTEVSKADRPPPSSNPSTRHAVLPGKNNPDIPVIAGLSCRRFLGYTEMQTFLNLLQGDRACSGERLDRTSGGYRQVNYLETNSGKLPVVIFSPGREIDRAKRMVIFLPGGPRAVTLNRPLVMRLVEQGYAVLIPIYLGELETRHPAADLPLAVKQVQALSRWAGKRLVAVVGISTGAHLAAASCGKACAPRILLAPPLTTPEEAFSPDRIRTAGIKIGSGFCLWRQNGARKVCAGEIPFLKSYWGKRYYRTSTAELLRGQCDRTRIVVSKGDKRIYNPAGIAALRAVGCRVDVFAGLEHWEMDADAEMNRFTTNLISTF